MPVLTPLVFGLAGAAGRGLMQLSQGRPLFSPRVTDRPGRRPGRLPRFSAAQYRMIQLIDREVGLNRVGLPRVPLTIAMVVNAWAESRLNPLALNQTAKEQSVGLFQVNRSGSLGRPYSIAELADPTNNTRVILSEVRRQSDTLRQARTVGELVAMFCSEVERPANRYVRGRERAQIARQWFGSSVVDSPLVKS